LEYRILKKFHTTFYELVHRIGKMSSMYRVKCRSHVSESDRSSYIPSSKSWWFL